MCHYLAIMKEKRKMDECVSMYITLIIGCTLGWPGDHWPGTLVTKVRRKETMRPLGPGLRSAKFEWLDIRCCETSAKADKLPGKESWWSLWIISTYEDQNIFLHCYIPRNVLLKCQALFIKFWQLEYSFSSNEYYCSFESLFVHFLNPCKVVEMRNDK